MKKVIFSMAIAAFLLSCGGGDSEKKEATDATTEPAKTEPATTDLSDNRIFHSLCTQTAPI